MGTSASALPAGIKQGRLQKFDCLARLGHKQTNRRFLEILAGSWCWTIHEKKHQPPLTQTTFEVLPTLGWPQSLEAIGFSCQTGYMLTLPRQESLPEPPQALDKMPWSLRWTHTGAQGARSRGSQQPRASCTSDTQLNTLVELRFRTWFEYESVILTVRK